MLRNKKLGFTFMEAIVIIVILCLLLFIGLSMLQGYIKNGRDSARMSSLKEIGNAIKINNIKKGSIPNPDKMKNITFNDKVVWKQGTIGDNCVKNTGVINKKPTDPLTGNEYSYSYIPKSGEFEIGTILEGDSIKKIESEQKINVRAYIGGNYNGKFTKININGVSYFLALPSITSSDLNKTNIIRSIVNKSIAFTNLYNVPDSYKGNGFINKGGFKYSPKNLVIFKGDINLLEKRENKIEFIKNLKTAYKGSEIENNFAYKEFINIDTTKNAKKAEEIMNNYMKNSIGGL